MREIVDALIARWQSRANNNTMNKDEKTVAEITVLVLQQYRKLLTGGKQGGK